MALSLYSAAQALLASLSPRDGPAEKAAILLDLLLSLLGQPGGEELLAARGAFDTVAAACKWTLVGVGVLGIVAWLLGAARFTAARRRHPLSGRVCMWPS